jgi:hypothetical protein
MLRFLRQRQRRFVCALFGAALFLPAALIIFLGCCASEARAREELLSKTGAVDHSIIIREHAGWNQDCDAIAHPALYLNEPPRHGHVCARIENIKIQSMFVGTESQCVGRVIRGVQLVYRPDSGYTGNDGLRYAARYPSVLRAVSVLVTVVAFPADGPMPAPSSMTTPTPPLPQPAGPVPACEELIF